MGERKAETERLKIRRRKGKQRQRVEISDRQRDLFFLKRRKRQINRDRHEIQQKTHTRTHA